MLTLSKSSLQAPPQMAGDALPYLLRGHTRQQRANLACNGVPTLTPPYTDKQLTQLFEVSRYDLKIARARAEAEAEIAKIEVWAEPKTLVDIIRDAGPAAAWDALVVVMDEMQK